MTSLPELQKALLNEFRRACHFRGEVSLGRQLGIALGRTVMYSSWQTPTIALGRRFLMPIELGRQFQLCIALGRQHNYPVYKTSIAHGRHFFINIALGRHLVLCKCSTWQTKFCKSMQLGRISGIELGRILCCSCWQTETIALGRQF